MRPIKRIKFTEEGLENLKKEKEELLSKRPAAVSELRRARELGDLSENGLYKAARAALSSIDARLRRIDGMIKLADVIEKPNGVVGIGSKVLVRLDGNEAEYNIVGDYEADPSTKSVSANSPIGRSLIGKRAGETAEFETPGGKKTINVIKVI